MPSSEQDISDGLGTNAQRSRVLNRPVRTATRQNRILVTRKGTSINRIFTWLPDLTVQDAHHDAAVSVHPSLTENHHNNNAGNVESALTRPEIGSAERAQMDRKKSLFESLISPIISMRMKPIGMSMMHNSNDDHGARKVPSKVQVLKRSPCFSCPAFKLRAFNTENSYSTDVIMIYTNAIRYSSQCLYTILFNLHQRKSDDIQSGDLFSFFLWFEDYHNFFCNFISLVNDIFLPALRDIIPFRHDTPSYFPEEGQRLNRIVNKTITTTKQKFVNYMGEDIAVVIDKLTHIYCGNFAQSLCSYLYSLEKYCAAVCAQFCTTETSMIISKSLANALKQMPNFHRSLPILLQWLQHRPQTTFNWLYIHYNYITVRLYRIWRKPTEHEKTYKYFERMINST